MDLRDFTIPHTIWQTKYHLRHAGRKFRRQTNLRSAGRKFYELHIFTTCRSYIWKQLINITYDLQVVNDITHINVPPEACEACFGPRLLSHLDTYYINTTYTGCTNGAYVYITIQCVYHIHINLVHWIISMNCLSVVYYIVHLCHICSIKIFTTCRS